MGVHGADGMHATGPSGAGAAAPRPGDRVRVYDKLLLTPEEAYSNNSRLPRGYKYVKVDELLKSTGGAGGPPGAKPGKG